MPSNTVAYKYPIAIFMDSLAHIQTLNWCGRIANSHAEKASRLQNNNIDFGAPAFDDHLIAFMWKNAATAKKCNKWFQQI